MKGRPGDPVITQVVEATRIARDTARRRVKQFRAGLIDCDSLFAPCGWNAHKGRPRPPENPLVKEVTAATGLTRSGAVRRILKVRSGALPRELLMASTQEVLDYMARAKSGRKIDTCKDDNWGDLGLGPRRSVASINGATAWERKHLGAS